MKKTLIITEWAPPLNEGSPILMRNLLNYFPDGSYAILMDTLKEHYRRVDKTCSMNCPYYFFNLPLYNGRSKGIRRIFTIVELLFLPLLVIKGVRIVRKENADTILAPTNNRGFFLSSYFVHKITKRPLFLFMFDLFEEVQPSRIKKCFCRLLERKMVKSAAKVFVSTEKMKQYYEEKYGLCSEVIPHSVDVPLPRSVRVKHRAPANGAAIVYTGSVYSAHYDSMIRLINVVNALPSLTLYLYTTPRQGDFLERSAPLTERVIIRCADRTDISRIQSKADILFLPYTFESRHPLRVIIENQAPAKVPEYLVSGTPILLHAPSYSFLCQYNKENEFALTVDEPSEEALKTGIMCLLNDRGLREKVVRNAFATAKDHDARKVSAKLQRYLLN